MVCPCCCPSGTTRCEGDCCRPCGSLIKAVVPATSITESICGFSPSTTYVDEFAQVTTFLNFGQIVTAYGPDGIYDTLKSSAIEKYTGSKCQFVELQSYQFRTNNSRVLNEEGVCVNYVSRILVVYRVYFFIYRCGSGQWESVTDEILISSFRARTDVYDNFSDAIYGGGNWPEGEPPPVPLPPGFTMPDGNPPPRIAMPSDVEPVGPYPTNCSNVFP